MSIVAVPGKGLAAATAQEESLGQLGEQMLLILGLLHIAQHCYSVSLYTKHRRCWEYYIPLDLLPAASRADPQQLPLWCC